MINRKEMNPGGAVFFGQGDSTDLDSLEMALTEGLVGSSGLNRIAAIFTEFPSNPLMKCPDLIRWAAWHFVVVVMKYCAKYDCTDKC